VENGKGRRPRRRSCVMLQRGMIKGTLQCREGEVTVFTSLGVVLTALRNSSGYDVIC